MSQKEKRPPSRHASAAPRAVEWERPVRDVPACLYRRRRACEQQPEVHAPQPAPPSASRDLLSTEPTACSERDHVKLNAN